MTIQTTNGKVLERNRIYKSRRTETSPEHRTRPVFLPSPRADGPRYLGFLCEQCAVRPLRQSRAVTKALSINGEKSMLIVPECGARSQVKPM